MRLLLDTNTVVSGFLWQNAPRKLIDAALEGRVELFTSVALIDELADILRRDKFAKRLAHHGLSVSALVERYELIAETVEPAEIARTVAADPDDDRVLAAALAAGVDFIVSGDVHLLNLKAHQRTPIVSAAEALARINKQQTRDTPDAG